MTRAVQTSSSEYFIPITGIMDTAYMTAFYRAQESTREGAYFHDPYAQSLAGERGEQIVKALPEKLNERRGIVIRTCVYDEILMQLIKEEEVDTILNLGCGLDTRPYRLALPEWVRWIEVDFPDLLAYKTKKLADAQPSCQLEMVPLDITDRKARNRLFTRIDREAKQTLVLTEGLLIYLTNSEMTTLATDLYRQPTFCWWLTELASSQALAQYANVWNTLVPQNVQTRFDPTNREQFFRQYGWRIDSFRIPLEEALRLKMDVPLAWLARLLLFIAKLKPEFTLQGTGIFLFGRI